ncbi:MAG: RAMP superfamily CRISPR-associated protein [Alcaligenaceae bacterium]|nr:RAMP superfamily CRISPR-associated protein [Alcaligenaceae bacterium]
MTKIFLNRYIIDTTSPMAISSGRREVGFDTQLARDANGLPYIPSTSFTGVWRHLAQDVLDEKVVKQWFGDLNLSNEVAGLPKLHIHHGLLLDGQGKVVLGLLPKLRLEEDKLLQRLLDVRPHYRDHVRINDRGVATEYGKFDKILLPKGIRFCVDIRWQGDESHEESWLELQKLLSHPHFALGSSTRNGFGRFKIVATLSEKLDLEGNPGAGEQLVKFIKRSDLPVETELIQNNQPAFATLELSALDVWRCGKGSRPLGEASEHTDSFVYSEPYVRWEGTRAIWEEKPQVVLCGSSIKGILAHRLAYHYRRLTNQFADSEMMVGVKHANWQQRPDELRDLLGDDSQVEGNQLAGSLIVEDVVINKVKPQIRTHTSIDRFTGGVRFGALYSEEVLWQPDFKLKLHVVPNTRITSQLRDALAATLEDLKEGLLPLGAGSGRGNSLVINKPNQVWEIQWDQIGLREEIA